LRRRLSKSGTPSTETVFCVSESENLYIFFIEIKVTMLRGFVKQARVGCPETTHPIMWT
jgi:hypothetical protein